MSTCFTFAILLVFLCGSTGFQDDSESGRDFIVAELIHRDSSMSPFYNSSKTASEQMREAVTRSLNRINNSNSSLHFGEKDIISKMIPSKAEYLMKLKGDNSQEFLLMVSTGSGFTWIDCNDQANVPYFIHKSDKDSKGSYEEISRYTQECRALDTSPGPLQISSTESDYCTYEYSYPEKIETKGILSRAEFHLDATDAKVNSYSFPLIFGCCTDRTKSILNSRIQGVVGLGHRDLSLIFQLWKELNIDKQLSYCLLPLGSNNPTKLVFGKSAKFSGKRDSKRDSKILLRTNFDSPYYYLTLVRASVEGKETQTLQNADNNMIIDSGTTVTSLDPIIFSEVRSFVIEHFNDIRPVEDKSELCYSIEDVSTATLPNIELYFEGFKGKRSSITLKPINTFIMYTDDQTICMNIVPAKKNQVSVLGSLAQLGFHVEYNLEKKKKSIYFTPADCKEFGRQSS